MRKILKIVKWLAIIFVVFLIGGVLVLLIFFPNVSPATDMKIVSTPDMVARGKYLAHHVSGCVVCHGEMDKTKWGNPLVAGTEGKGSGRISSEDGFPGELNMPNITPAGPIASYTDGEIYRAITAGVKKDGSVIFPIMPYTEHRNMDPEDVKAIIAYVRSIPPIKNDVPASSVSFPVNLFVRMAPSDPPAGVKRPSGSETVKYGEYMVNAAGCAGCHTPRGMSGPDVSKAFSGGNDFPMKGYGTAFSANITPDPETGIGNWSEEAFVSKFKSYEDPANCATIDKGKQPFTAMPWNAYAGMDTFDLKAIYAYLKTIKPIKNQITKWKKPE